MRRNRSFAFAVLAMSLLSGGCGYTTKSMLPENIKNVAVPPVKNSIDLSGEVTDKTPFRTYRPGLEVDLTNAIINRFIFDGNLKVAPADKADAIVKATLREYRRDPLRYSEGDDVQEYRLSIGLEVEVTQASDGKQLWHETVVGDSTFFLSGSHAVSEDEAAAKAVEDVARRVVDKTIELW